MEGGHWFMSKTVDERVVEMDFDNQKFEKNVQTTMSTLDKLKSALNMDGASKGLENLDKAAQSVSLEGIAAGVEALQNRFSTMGIVGMTAVAKITSSVMDLGAKMTSFVTSTIKNGGIRRAMNLENANFQLQGLLKDGEAVAAVMEDVSYAVDGTAYSLDAAASVASQLAASGMRAGTDMKAALRGVAGVAAMTNSEYSDIGRIFTQVAGQGKVMGDQLLQLSSRGMNAAATLAEYLGKTEAEVRDMVSKGEIDFATFAAAMDDAFGEHAKAANETVNGAFANVKSALGRIGALFVSPLIVQNGSIVQLLNTLRERINEIKTFVEPVAKVVTDGINSMADAANNFLKKFEIPSAESGWSELAEQVTAAGVSVDDFKNTLIETAREHGVAIDAMIEETGSFENSLTKGWLSLDIVSESLGKFIDGTDEAASSTEDLNDKLEYFQDVVDKVWNGDFKNAPVRYQLLADAGYDYAKVQALVNKTVDGHRLTLEDLSDEQLISIGYTEEQVETLKALKKQAEQTGTPLSKLIDNLSKPSPKQMLLTSIKAVLEDIGKVLNVVKESWNEIFGSDDNVDDTNPLVSLIEKFYDFVQASRITEETLDNLSSVFNGFFAALDVGKMMSKGLLGFLYQIIKTVGKVFSLNPLEMIARIGDLLVTFRDWIMGDNELVNGLKSLKDAFIDFLQHGLELLVLRLPEFLGIFKTFIEDLKLADGFSFDNLATAFSNLWENFKNFGSTILGDFSGIKDAIWNFVKSILNMIGITDEAFDNFVNNLTWDNFLNFLTELGESIRNFKMEDLFSGAGGNIIDGLVNGLKAGADKVWDAIVFIGEKVMEAFCALLGIHSPSTVFFEFGQNIIQGLAGGIKAAVGLIGDAIVWIGDSILKAWDTIVEVVSKIDWGVVATGIVGVGSFIILNKTADALDNFSKAAVAVTSPAKSLSKLMDTFGASIAKLGDAAALKMKSEAFRNLAIAIGILVASIFVLTQLDVGAVWASIGAIAALTAIMLAASFALNKIGEMADVIDAAKIAGMLLAIGGALLLFGITVKVLAGISDEGMSNAMAGIVMFGLIVASLLAITKYSKGTWEVVAAGELIKTVGVAMLMMAVVAKILAGMSWEELGKAAVGLTFLTGIIVGLIAATKLATDKEIDEVKNLLRSIAGSMLILVGVAKLIATMSWEDMGKAAVGITFLGGIIVGLIAASKLATEKQMVGIASTIFAVGASMAMLILVSKMIVGMSWDEMKKAAAGLTYLSALVIGLVAATRVAGGNELKGVASTLLAMSISIAILAGVCVLLGLVDTKTLAKGIVAVGLLVGLCSVMVIATNKGKSIKKDTFVGMAIAIGVMAAALIVLSFIDTKDLLKSVVALSAVMVAFGEMMKRAGQMKNLTAKGFATIITMVGVLGILAGLLYLLKDLPIESTLANAAALSVMMIAFAGALKIMQGVHGVSKQVTKTMLELVGIVAILAILIGLLSGCDPVGAIGSAVAMSILLSALSVCMIILQNVRGMDAKAIGAVYAMAGVVAVLALILGIMSGLQVEASIQTAISLSLLLIALSACCLILAGVGMAGPAGFVGIGVLAALIGAMGLIMAAIAGLNQLFPGMNEFLESSLPTLELIAEGLGSFLGTFVGSVIESFADQVMNVIPDFATKLSEFMENIQPFVDGAAAMAGVDFSGIGNLALAIIELTGANFLEAIGSFLTGGRDLASFADQLVPFGEAMVKYAETVGAVDSAIIVESANAAKALVEVANSIPAEGGLWQLMAGEHNLGQFADQLVLFGAGMKLYAAEVAGLDTSSIINSITPAKGLVSIANSIPTTGGIWQFATGEQNLGAFGVQLALYGAGLKAYGDAVQGLDAEAVTNSIAPAKGLVSIANAIPTSGGLWQCIDGSQDLGTFGAQLAAYGVGLKAYGDSVSGLAVDAINESIAPANSLIELSKIIPTSGGLWQCIDGSQDLGTFGSQLALFGAGMKSYSDNVTDLNSEAITNSVGAAKGLIEIANSIPEDGGLWGVITGSNKDLGSFAGQLVKLGEGMSDYAESVADVDMQKISNSADCINRLKNIGDALVDMDYSGIQNFDIEGLGTSLSAYSENVAGVDTEHISNSITNIRGLINMIQSMVGLDSSGVSTFKAAIEELKTIDLSNIAEQFSGATEQFTAVGTNIVNAISRGIGASSGAAITASQQLISRLITAIQGRGSQFITIGTLLATRFKMGLAKGLSESATAVRSALDSCLGAMRSYQSSFAGVGKDLGQGLVSGISSKQQAAYDAGYALGQAAVQGEKDGQQSNSPSKLTIKAGKWLGEGLVIGMNRMGKAVYQSGKSMGAQAFDSISNALTGVDTLMSNVSTIHPVVAPVVDMSNMQYRAMDFQLNANLDALVSQPVNSLSAIMSEAQAKIDASNMAVVDAVSGLRDDLNSMYEADDQEIALYVDSRKLASSIAKPMNRRLNIVSRRGEGL
jgi:tape measure domain-containing protein